VIESLSIQIHYDSLRRGVIAAADAAYFLILIAAWIYASMFVVEERKAS
jgi:hypothetical protein